MALSQAQAADGRGQRPSPTNGAKPQAGTTADESGRPERTQRSRAGRPAESIALLIVDEHAVVRAGVRTLLDGESGVEVVAEAESVDEAVERCRASAPDVVLMDVDEASSETVDDLRRLRREVPQGAIVVLTGRDDDDDVFRAVVGGAAGHVSNSAQPEELVDTIRRAATGEHPISQTLARRPAVGRRVLETFVSLAARGPARPSLRPSDRDLRILTFAAQGMTNQLIGRELALSEHTVKAAISRILGRLGLRHRTEAVVYAMREGWIEPRTMAAAGAAGAVRPFVSADPS